MKKNRIAILSSQTEWESHLVQKANEITRQLTVESPKLNRFFYESPYCSFILSKVQFTSIDAVYRWQKSLERVRFYKIFETHPELKESFMRYLAKLNFICANKPENQGSYENKRNNS